MARKSLDGEYNCSLTVKIPPELLEEIDSLARRSGMARAAYVRELLQRTIAAQQSSQEAQNVVRLKLVS